MPKLSSLSFQSLIHFNGKKVDLREIRSDTPQILIRSILKETCPNSYLAKKIIEPQGKTHQDVVKMTPEKVNNLKGK